jgi:hypothetical protein
VPSTKADLEGVRPAANAFTVSTLNSIGFAKLKQVFKQRKNSRRKHNAGFGFAAGFI